MPKVNIKITGIDAENVGRPRKDGTRGSDLYPVPFVLSEIPPYEWAEIFDASWKNRMYSMRRRAHVSGNWILMEATTVEEVEEHHKAELTSAVTETNNRYNEWIVQVDEAQRVKQEADEALRKKIEKRVEDVNKNW